MTGKGYSRLKPRQTGLCATCQDYGRENFDALKAWGTDVRKFCERIELALPEQYCFFGCIYFFFWFLFLIGFLIVLQK